MQSGSHSFPRHHTFMVSGFYSQTAIPPTKIKLGLKFNEDGCGRHASSMITLSVLHLVFVL